MLEFEIIRDEPRFDALEPVWNPLLKKTRSDCLFTSFEWLRTWWRFYSVGLKLFIVLIKEAGEPIGIAPFCILRRSFMEIERDELGASKLIIPAGPWDPVLSLKELCFLGSGDVCSDYLDIICRPDRVDEAMPALSGLLWEHRREWDTINLDFITADSLAATSFCPPSKSQVWVTRRPLIKTLFTPLPDSFEEYLTTLSPNSRSNIRRYNRKLLGQFPDAEFRFHADSATLDCIMDTFIALHQARWTAAGEPGAFSNETFIRFHKSMARIGLERGWLRLGVIEGGGEALFVCYCYRYGDRLYQYQLGMKHLAGFSLGSAGISQLIERCIGEGARAFDLLRGEEEYKTHWAKEAVELFQVRWVQQNLQGGAFYLHNRINTSPRLRSTLKKLFRKSAPAKPRSAP